MPVRPNICALAVITKAPQAGTSKTRLSPPLTATEAAALSACFLRDTCENIAHISSDGTAEGIVVYTPVGAEGSFAGLLPSSFRLLAQRGGSLRERLVHACEDLFSLGYDSLCLVDSDSPTLPAEFLRAAVSALAHPGDRVVLGPARDGGYYLIGLKTANRHMFEDIDWSTSTVFKQTVARAKECKLPLTILSPWFDVDDAETLGQLYDEMFHTNGKPAPPLAPTPYHAPHTRSYLHGLFATDVAREGLLKTVDGFGKTTGDGVEDAT